MKPDKCRLPNMTVVDTTMGFEMDSAATMKSGLNATYGSLEGLTSSKMNLRCHREDSHPNVGR
jgi:alcohol dehydrogenase class IV